MQEQQLREFVVKEGMWKLDSNHRTFLVFTAIDVANDFQKPFSCQT